MPALFGKPNAREYWSMPPGRKAMSSIQPDAPAGKSNVKLKVLRRSALLAALLMAELAGAGELNMRVFALNDHLLAFYDGRPAESKGPRGTADWADFGAMNVGVATYAIHQGDQALVYDTYPSTPQAQWVRDYLVNSGVRRFTLVNSHWHLDHVGGNAVYADVDRIATDKTIRLLEAKKAAIEAGSEWGPPAISPLVIPNIGISTTTTYRVGDIQVELRPVNIHSEDGLVVYLPGDRILLAGDTLEDTLTFIVEPLNIPVQYRNLRKLKEWKISRIFPNHGNPDVIANGGYRTTLIDATRDYLRRMVLHAHDVDYLNGSLDDYVRESVRKGWVTTWWAYRDAHETNLARVAKAYRDRPLPVLPAEGSATASESAR
jgi:glyoxylase-like metal-dependent hydrolase (beta-lactamase superfamily II)